MDSRISAVGLALFTWGNVQAGDEASYQGCLEAKFVAEDARAIDETTGMDLRVFPPDRVVDYHHMKLELRFEDLAERRFSATETLRFAPIAQPAESLRLDAVGLLIREVTLGGRPVEHYQDDETLTLRFDPPILPGAAAELRIRYECIEPVMGMFFTPASDLVPWVQVHTQGESNFNRYWFACHDFPNERLSTEVVMDVPSGYAASSNGKLVAHTDDGRRAVWHYLQAKPHVNYLVALVIGKFDIVELPGGPVPMRAWVPPGKGPQAIPTFGRTAQMMDVFEERFGVPYPWDRYDQVLTRSFGAGGMENTSATTMYATAVLDDTAILDGDQDGLISHELAHQWTGDFVTCRSWAHIWLNEGWATYGTALWYEYRDGEDGYVDSIRRNYERLIDRDRAGSGLPMVSVVYENPSETFGRAANPYPKGASILHMLRSMLGDEVFFAGTRDYMSRHALGTAETADFRDAMEEASGLGLEWFFEQWCYRTGVPELAVDVTYEPGSRTLVVALRQTQKIDEQNPAFRFELPVYVRTAGGAQTIRIDVRERSDAATLVLDGPPVLVAVDPWLTVLKKATTVKPLSLWIAQAAGGPTIASRHEAIAVLADHDQAIVVDLLAKITADESVRHTLRRSAVRALVRMASGEARARYLAILRDGVADPRVRADMVEGLRGFEPGEVKPLLAETARSDPSYATRVAAIEVLAGFKAKDQADAFVELVEYPSHADQVRNAAIAALAALDDARGLAPAMAYSVAGYSDRSRAQTIHALGKLAHHDADTAVPFLIALLDDPERRAVNSAGDALAEIGDKRATGTIRAISQSSPDPRLRARAEGWLKKLE